MEYDIVKLKSLIDQKNIPEIKNFIQEHNLIIKNGKIYPKDEDKAKIKEEYEFWDQRQYVRKILLNSLYGALLNRFSRFYDERIGQSVTLSGRNITKFMASKINETITGEFKYDGEACVYGDTDSVYFSATNFFKKNNIEFEHTKENYIELYDEIADLTNKSFPKFLLDTFNVPKKYCQIKAGRELIATTGLFIAKKMYGVMIYDKEKIRLDTGNKPGKIKAMGLAIKRTDTPKVIQKFLEEILTDILLKYSEKEIMEKIKKFREDFKKWEPWKMGSPKKVNNLSEYQEKYENASKKNSGKVNLPGHVRASINYNKLLDINNDMSSMRITDGSKIIICKLLNNTYNMTSIAYPTDENNLPVWFKQLPFDIKSMEEVLIDKKVETLIKVLNWNLNKSISNNNIDDLFIDEIEHVPNVIKTTSKKKIQQQNNIDDLFN